jgi:hypothetical protein
VPENKYGGAFKPPSLAVLPPWKCVVGAISIAGDEGLTCIPKNLKKSRAMIGNGVSALRKANVYSRPLNSTAAFTKFNVN